MSHSSALGWLTMTAWWQYAVSKARTLVIVTGGMLTKPEPTQPPVFMTYRCSSDVNKALSCKAKNFDLQVNAEV